MSFLPDNYQPQQTASVGTYLKFKEGTTRFRILSPQAKTGWVYWSNQNKPVRLKEQPLTNPPDIRLDEKTKLPERIKHFWVLVVFDYGSSAPCILEITQATIQRSIHGLCNDSDWGNPNDYDIKVTRVGSGIETDYQVAPVPHKPFDYALATGWEDIDLEKLFSQGDPFEGNDDLSKAAKAYVEGAYTEKDAVASELDYKTLGFKDADHYHRTWVRFEEVNTEARLLGLNQEPDPLTTTNAQLTAIAQEIKAKTASAVGALGFRDITHYKGEWEAFKEVNEWSFSPVTLDPLTTTLAELTQARLKGSEQVRETQEELVF